LKKYQEMLIDEMLKKEFLFNEKCDSSWVRTHIFIFIGIISNPLVKRITKPKLSSKMAAALEIFRQILV